MMRLLEGSIVEDVGGAGVDELREENRELRMQLMAARREAENAKRETAHALEALRKVLSPLYRALQQVFGELEAVGLESDAPIADASPRHKAVWESWKQRLGEGPAKVIDALLLHGEMNTQQLAVVTGYHRTTIPAFIFKLNKNGLLVKNGGRFSLKKF